MEELRIDQVPNRFTKENLMNWSKKTYNRGMGKMLVLSSYLREFLEKKISLSTILQDLIRVFFVGRRLIMFARGQRMTLTRRGKKCAFPTDC